MSPYRPSNKNYIFANILLLAVFSFFAAALYWACHAKLDEVVRGMGRVIPASQVKTIQNLEGGILSSVLVHEGQKVQAGQVLIQLDDTAFNAQVKEKMAEKYGIEASIARLTAEYGNHEIKFPKHLIQLQPELVERETSFMNSRKATLMSELKIQTQSIERYNFEIKEKTDQIQRLKIDLEIINEKVSILKPLVEKNAASKIELLDLKQKLNQLESSIEGNLNQLPKIKAAIETAKSKKTSLKKKYLSSILSDLSNQKNQLATLEQALPALEDRLSRTTIRAPVSGLVKRVFVHTIGGVIGSGDPLVQIVPKDDELLVEAKILPKDIAFLHLGQTVNIKLTAYDFSIYGGLDGTLDHISADAILSEEGYSYFLIRIKLAETHISYGNKLLPIIPGMDCQVDIMSGSKTVMDYMLKPILKAKQTALQEP